MQDEENSLRKLSCSGSIALVYALCRTNWKEEPMQIIFDDAALSSPGVWLTHVSPHELGRLGSPAASSGGTSILLAKSPALDDEKGQLAVTVEGLSLLNLGTTARTLVVDSALQDTHGLSDGAGSEGPGDRDYRTLVDMHLKGEVREVAHDILTKVRAKHSGDLKRGERNNFSNTPRNFWYAIVQPRTQSLSITVPGEPDSFGSSSLHLGPDRPGYTRFQVRSFADATEALRLIEAAWQATSRLRRWR